MEYVITVGARLQTKSSLAKQYGVSGETINKWIRQANLPVKIPSNGSPFKGSDIILLHFAWVGISLYDFTYKEYREEVVELGKAKKFHQIFKEKYGGGDLRQALRYEMELKDEEGRPLLTEGQCLTVLQIIDYIDFLEQEEAGEQDADIDTSGYTVGTTYHAA